MYRSSLIVVMLLVIGIMALSGPRGTPTSANAYPEPGAVTPSPTDDFPPTLPIPTPPPGVYTPTPGPTPTDDSFPPTQPPGPTLPPGAGLPVYLPLIVNS